MWKPTTIRSSATGAIHERRGTLGLVIFLAAAVCLLPTAAFPQAKLLFESGFEPNVYVTTDYQDLRGSDGMDWQTDFEGYPEVERLFFVYCGAVPTSAFADLRPGPVDANNQVLYMQVNADDDTHSAQARAQIHFGYETTGPDLFEQGYIKFRMYLHPDMNELKNYHDKWTYWFDMMEWWEEHDPNLDGDGAGQARWSVLLGKDEGDTLLFWRIRSEYMQPAARLFDPIWPQVENRTVPVPIGQWATLETFFKRGDASNGRIYMAITPDGGEKQVIFDIHNYTQHSESPRPLASWHFFKLYTSDTVLDWLRARNRKIRAYYDDFEWWDSLPGSGADTIAPAVSSVSPLSRTRIKVQFNGIIDSTTAVSTANYAMNKNVIVSSASLGADAQTINLTVTALSADTTYTLTIGSVEDESGNAMSSTDQTFTFTD